MTDPPVCRVALDVPLRRLFDYLGPEKAATGRAGTPPGPIAQPGVRVRVPFGRQRLIGVIVECAASAEVAPERLKRALQVLDEQPLFDAAALGILRWAADYYHHPIGEVMAASLPRALRTGAATVSAVERWYATAKGREAHERGDPRRAPRQRRLLQLLLQQPGMQSELLAEQHSGWRTPARALADRGWIESRRMVLQPDDGAPILRTAGPPLGEEQRNAVELIGDALSRFGAFVLHGVTGSGKTEVYLRLVERVLALGKRALVLVPEIGLTPQLVERFQQRFDTPLCVLHSALTEHERLLAWRAAFSGHANIVLGTRSAVFAPLPELGLIVVDEEHDPSFKQHEGGFRYSARDMAVMRAQRAGVPVVLGSATPALETLSNVLSGRYDRISLPRRTAQVAPPRMALIDLRTSAVRSGISTPAVQAIERHLREDGQILVFLNRRGYAPTLLCRACGWIAPCEGCDARMTVHLAAARLRCHHCGAERALPRRCPQCGFEVRPVGQGTERLEETLAKLFPAAPLVRLDRDVIRKREEMVSAMHRMRSGEARILVGTQMVTKGHDFPDVTLVVVLNADQGLFSSDFRAPERLAQTIVQVAGRAGRAARAGEVLIQTEYPDHPLLVSLLREGYDGFARAALAERAQACWPPFSRLAAVRDSARTAAAALEFLSDARKISHPGPQVKLLGPVAAAMAKRAGRYHAQLLVESTERAPLHQFLDGWLPQLAQLPSSRRVRWALDVDPIELF